MNRSRVCLFLGNLSGGGAERVMVNIANELARRGHEVELLLARSEGEYLSLVDPAVKVHAFGTRLIRTLIPLARRLRERRPAALLVAGEHAGAVAVVARALAHVPLRLVLSLHGFNGSAEDRQNLKDIAGSLLARGLFRFAEHVVCVSDGLRQSAVRRIGGREERYLAIYNPIYSKDIGILASAKGSHRWLYDSDRVFSVVLAVGRLVRVKGFDDLLAAIELVRRSADVRLILLGEGPQEVELRELARRLGISESVDFCGFVENPYWYMAQVDALVMSSKSEGFGNVLVEAMVVGTPVVSTNCPYGPAEILGNGKYGTLVTPGDPHAIAEGILAVLGNPTAASVLVERAKYFSIERAADGYERAMGIL